MNVAFKEWAVVCDALASGRQTLILRKGGTQEDEGQFRPDHDEFLLFPTYTHEAYSKITAEARPKLAALEVAKPDAGTLVISHFAAITEALEVKSLDVLKALRPYHIWAETEIEERFTRWREDRVYGLVVRVFALPRSVRLPMRPAYSGCKSWVHLETEVATQDSQPIMNELDFDNRACAIRLALGGDLG